MLIHACMAILSLNILIAILPIFMSISGKKKVTHYELITFHCAIVVIR